MSVQYITFSIIFHTSVVKSMPSQNFEGFVVGGVLAKIQDFPHVALLCVECRTKYEIGYYACGSSILNEAFIITAAHCLALESCRSKTPIITIFVGNRELMKGLPYLASSYKIHEDYDDDRGRNDIGLVRLKSKLTFKENVKRVAVMKKPPQFDYGRVAGWGLVDVSNGSEKKPEVIAMS